MTVNFTNHFELPFNVLVTFLISTSSNVSVPSSLQFEVSSQTTGLTVSSRPGDPPTNLPEGPYQHNFTVLPNVPAMMFDKVKIIITRNVAFQWVAISRIIFCGATTNEGLLSHPPLTHPMCYCCYVSITIVVR